MSDDTIILDGSSGEGGGQILRTALALSLITGRPFRMENVRAGREKPGLMRQHLTAVLAAAEIGGAKVEGAELKSQRLSFEPTHIVPGRHRFAMPTAGSTTLVFQTVLPPLLHAKEPSTLEFEGGTHNPFAPPFDFLAKAFLPLINRMGPRVEAKLERAGFAPAGGGRFTVGVTPAEKLAPLHLTERGDIRRQVARGLVAHLPRHIAERELDVVRQKLGWEGESLVVEELTDPAGPGNALLIEVESEHVTEVFTGIGQIGLKAEGLATRTVDEARRYLGAGVPVGEHLADQLLLPLALAGGGSYRTVAPTRHTLTQVETVRRFVEVPIAVEREADKAWVVRVG